MGPSLLFPGVDPNGGTPEDAVRFQTVVRVASSVLSNLVSVSQSKQRYPGRIQMQTAFFVKQQAPGSGGHPKRNQPQTPLEASPRQDKKQRSPSAKGKRGREEPFDLIVTLTFTLTLIGGVDRPRPCQPQPRRRRRKSQGGDLSRTQP